MKYEEKIHSKQFRMLLRKLNESERPIAAILHVKQPLLLLTLAGQIELLAATQKTPEAMIRSLEPLLRNQTLLLSFPELGPNPFSSFCVPDCVVRPSAWSKVIYLPPFYLAFTPGLFEATARQLDLNVNRDPVRNKPALRFKI